MKKLLIIFSFIFIAACGGNEAGQVSVPGVDKNSKEAAEFLEAVKGKAIVPLRSSRGFPVGYFKDNGDIASRYHHPTLQGDLIFIGMSITMLYIQEKDRRLKMNMQMHIQL